MMRRLRAFIRNFKLTLKMKLVLSLSSIAVILLVSSFISIMEYSRMSSYVSDLIAANIGSINASQRLANASNAYNLAILAVIGDKSVGRLPELKQEEFLAHCDSLRASLTSEKMMPLADSVLYSYSAFMLTSLELPETLLKDFSEARAWYFDRLQPKYARLRSDIYVLNDAIYQELRKNSETFERGFYRSIIPGAVAVAVGLLMVLMLMFFLIVYYVNPLNRMLTGLENYRSTGAKYTCHFEGDDELGELNRSIREIAGENQQLRKRNKALRTSLADQKAELAEHKAELNDQKAELAEHKAVLAALNAEFSASKATSAAATPDASSPATQAAMQTVASSAAAAATPDATSPATQVATSAAAPAATPAATSAAATAAPSAATSAAAPDATSPSAADATAAPSPSTQES